MIHIDLNIEPHNEQDDHHVYNSRAVAWLHMKDFFSFLDGPVE